MGGLQHLPKTTAGMLPSTRAIIYASRTYGPLSFEPWYGPATEQVFTIKMLAEKAINALDYKMYLLLIDMSKAFDTVNRPKHFEHLVGILREDELHLLSILTRIPKLAVRVNSKIGTSFETVVGIMQVPSSSYFT